jgi:serine/threonine-protein kinase PknG
MVELPEIEVLDPHEVVLTDPRVPDHQKFCGVPECGAPVGRGQEGRPGREEGYCAKCGHPFSFRPKLAPGDLVGGQYDVVGCLAHGGLGWVYLARDRNVENKWVVLKGLLNTGDADALAVAQAELKFLAEVDHPNIVRVINSAVHDGDPYIVMEYVGGPSLSAVVKRRREANGGQPDPLPVAHAIAYMLEVLPALGYLHHKGLLFCDLKPDNVILTGDALKLIDLGGVHRTDDEDSAVYGTPGYQAPEIADLGPSIASDLYTVGRTLAVLCTDFRSFQSTYEHSLRGPDEVELYARFDSLYRFLLRATAERPTDRFTSADEMADQLAGVLREIVAVDHGRTSHALSNHFTGELRTATGPNDRRALPIPLVDADDPAAGFLAAVGASNPDELMSLLAQAPERTVEVVLRIAREALEADDVDLADEALDELAPVGTQWRVVWYRALVALAAGDPVEARDQFARVYPHLPGELAPKLALGSACEAAGDMGAAAAWYDVVSRTDPSFTSAVFGLARCLVAIDERPAAVRAYDRVPASSSAYVDAQVAKAETILGADPSVLTFDCVLDAGNIIDGLPLRGEAKAQMHARVLHAALAVDRPSPNGTAPTLLGREPSEEALRRGLERTYRELAKYADRAEERIALVDEANRVRPRTLT